MYTLADIELHARDQEKIAELEHENRKLKLQNELVEDTRKLRDDLIVAALQGICQTMSRERIMDIYEGIQGGNIEAKTALIIADATLKARDKPT